MYEQFFGLREKPFSILPDPDLIFWTRTHQLAFAMLEFGVMNNAGFTVITGAIGSGKTTLLRHLLKKLGTGVNVGLISNTPSGREDLLQWILMSLGQPFDGSAPALFHRFNQYLHDQHERHRRTIVIIDEAQNLDCGSLEALRMLSNVNVDKCQILQLILVGQSNLRDLLCRPELTQFAQRIAADFHVTPLTSAEVAEYIWFRLAAVGANERLFTSEACDLIAQTSGGVPRAVNILCDTALVYAFAGRMRSVSLEIVKEVIEHKKAFGIFGAAKEACREPS